MSDYDVRTNLASLPFSPLETANPPSSLVNLRSAAGCIGSLSADQ
jgi:hypothetical protein